MIALGHEDAVQRNKEASEKSTLVLNKGCSSSAPHDDSQGVVGCMEFQDGVRDQSQEIEKKITPQVLWSDQSENSEACRQHHIYQHSHPSWLVNPDSSGFPMHQMNTFHAQPHPFSVNYRFQYAPVSSFHHNLQASQLQDFQYFVVIDFEATCDKVKVPYPQEIIEFPSVLVSSMSGQLEACFQTYVRPTCHQVLSDFCKDLTGIQQTQVNRGVTLSEALFRHDKWLEKRGIKHTNFAVVTWGDWDCRVMLESECSYKKIRKPPYFNRWINLKVPFGEVFGGVRSTLKDAVEAAGLSWQGRPHCGLDDAKNTARLLALIMRKGFKFSITNSLSCENGGSSNAAKMKPDAVSQQMNQNVSKVQLQFCDCGVTRSQGVIRKPGPKQGSHFFGCGNWTAATGARCHYFEWASPSTQ